MLLVLGLFTDLMKNVLQDTSQPKNRHRYIFFGTILLDKRWANVHLEYSETAQS